MGASLPLALNVFCVYHHHTTMKEKMAIITKDKKMAEYDVQTIW